MIIPELEGKKIALVAMGESQLDYHLSLAHSQEYDEVWAINVMAAVVKADRVFMMDPASRFFDTDDAGTQTEQMRRTLPKLEIPVYTCELDERVPSAVLYPLEEVMNVGGSYYLNNTVAYAIAFALYQKVGQLNVYGVDFTYKKNIHFAEAGRACCEFWLSKCSTAGIDIQVASRSGLLDTNLPIQEKLYGYHRLQDPPVALFDPEQGFYVKTFSQFQKAIREEQMKNVEIIEVLGAPEAKRY